jgi:hypothetical protein
MASKTLPVVSFNSMRFNFIEQFLGFFDDIVNPDIRNGIELSFMLIDKSRKPKITPTLVLATPDDAEEIVEIYRDNYAGTYPYKEMEDVEEVRRMIQDSNYEWLLFKDNAGNTMGCFTYELHFGTKKGYMRGLNVKQKYQTEIDLIKAIIGSVFGIWSRYQDRIGIWYCENRTAHASSQYLANICGVKPIGFLPNKDMFMNNIESDLLQVTYSRDVLGNLRSKEIPSIIPDVRACFTYTTRHFNLGDVRVISPHIKLDFSIIPILSNHINIISTMKKHGYEDYRISIDGTDSCLSFLHTPQVKNFEKVEYCVSSLEELYVVLHAFQDLAFEKDIRYCECFVSAYLPEHQHLFFQLGFTPRGYVPSWKYHTDTNTYGDQILFNWHHGPISEKMQLIEEGWELLRYLVIESHHYESN